MSELFEKIDNATRHFVHTALGDFLNVFECLPKSNKGFSLSNRGLVCLLKINVNTLPRDLKNTNVLIMKILSNGVASDEKCIETDVFIDIFLLSITFYMSMVSCKRFLWERSAAVKIEASKIDDWRQKFKLLWWNFLILFTEFGKKGKLFKGGYYCFIHPIFRLLVFGTLVTLVAGFLFRFFPPCPSCLAKCKQRLHNIFITSSPKVTKNQGKDIWYTRKTLRLLTRNIIYRVSQKYPDNFLKMGVASKWVKPCLQNFLCF